MGRHREEVGNRWPATTGSQIPTTSPPGPSRSHAPPERVWPWLVQVGRGRAGFYSDDLLDNGAVPSAQRIEAELQRLEIGQWVPMAERITPAHGIPSGPGRGAVRAGLAQAGQHLVLGPDADRRWRHPPGHRPRLHESLWLSSLSLEVGDFPCSGGWPPT